MKNNLKLNWLEYLDPNDIENNKKFVTLIGYGLFISTVFFAMPENPDEITAPIGLVNEFRLMSVLGVSSFWISIGLILGFFWNRFSIHKETTEFYN